MNYYLAECTKEDLRDSRYLKDIKIHSLVNKEYIINWVKKEMENSYTGDEMYTFNLIEWDNSDSKIRAITDSSGSIDDISRTLSDLLDRGIQKDTDFCIYEIIDEDKDGGLAALVSAFSILTKEEYVDLLI